MWATILSGMFWLLVIFGWMMIVVILAITDVWNREWRRCGLRLGILVGVWPLMFATLLAADYIHLFIMYPYYEWRVIEQSSNGAYPIFFRLADVGMVGSPIVTRSIVYNATGKPAMEVPLCPSMSEEHICQASTHLLGNFYVVELIQQ